MAVLHFPGFQHFWSLLKALLDLKAPLESPELTGDPTAPTQEPHDNSTKVATTEYVDSAVAELVNSSPAALDTLKELSDAIGGDANFSTTMTNALALKAPLASPALTGSPTAPTQNAGDNSTKIATTAYADRNDATCVHKTGDETVAGVKDFTGVLEVAGDHGATPGSGIVVKGARQNYAFAIKTDAVTKGTAPSAQVYNGVEFYGTAMTKYQDRLALLNHGITTQNVNTISLRAYSLTSAENTSFCEIAASVDASGNAYTSAPTPAAGDNSTKIATTAFVTTAVANEDATCVHTTGNETIAGTKTFSSAISGSITGNAATATKTTATIAVDKTGELVHAQMGTNDLFRIAVGGGSNAGWAEIATGDDYSEPIYVRQYQGSFATLKRTATLLDGSGNTSFPGTVTANSFSGPLVGNVTGNCSGNAASATKLAPQGGTALPTANLAVDGLQMVEVYNNSYPTNYGNVINVQGSAHKGAGQLLLGWSGTNNGIANIYYRNKRDAATTWSDWKTVAFTDSNITGSSGSCTGNAKTATTLATARDINISDADGTNTGTKISFNGSANGTIKLPATIKASITGNCSGSSGSCTGNAANVTGTVAIAHGGTGATTRLAALKALTNENVGTSAQHFLVITDSWGKGGYCGVASAKTVLGLKSAAYTESSAYATSGHTHSYLPLSGGTLTGNLNGTNIIFNGTLAKKHGSITKGTAPSSGTYYWTLNFADKNGIDYTKNTLAQLESRIGTDNKVYFYMRALKNTADTTTNAEMGVVYDTNNNTGWAYCPTPATGDNSTKIATTAWCRDATGDFACRAASAKTLSIPASGLKKGTKPTSTYWNTSWIRMDSAGTANANRLCELRSFVDTNGKSGYEMLAYDFKSGSSAAAILGIYKEMDGAAYGTAPTPAAADDSAKIATTAWCRDATGNFACNAATATTLHTARKINGVSFNGSADITVADSTKVAKTGDTMTGSLTQKHTGLVKGNTVAKWTCRDYRVIDNSGDSGDKPCISWWRTAVDTNKNVSVTLNAFKFADESTTSASIGIHYPASGDPYTSAPTPAAADNSTKIATTAFCKDFIKALSVSGRTITYTKSTGTTGTITTQDSDTTYGVFGVNYNGLVPGVSDYYKEMDFILTANGKWRSDYQSDRRVKQDFENIPEELIDIWGEVKWHQFLFKDEVKNRGENAKIHAGLVVQDLHELYEKHGIDIKKYAFTLHDLREAVPAKYDEDGNLVCSQQEAVDVWCLKYHEVLAFEALYLRKKIRLLEERLARMESNLT